MRSRMMREGSVGLLILAGLGVFGGGIAWFQGLNPANRSFTLNVTFPTISGVQAGSPVRYRGVTVGRISAVEPGPEGVDVKISITPADLLIPANSAVTIDQSGLLGESVVNLTPPAQGVPIAAAPPRDADCDPQVILCDGSRVKGSLGISTDALTASAIRFADLYGQPEFYQNVNQLTVNSGKAASEIATMSQDFALLARALRRETRVLSRTAAQIGQAAGDAGTTARQAGDTLDRVNGLLDENRSNLVTTLDNISQASATLKVGVGRIDSTFDRLSRSRLISDLETLSANAAETSQNLKQTSQALSDPTTIVSLQQTLDAARSAFQNAQKITADLDEITGDPETRRQFKNVIKGLGGLLVSSQQLQHNVTYAQQLEPAAARLKLVEQLEPPRAANSLPQQRARLQASPEDTMNQLTATSAPESLQTDRQKPQRQKILPPVFNLEPVITAPKKVVK